MTLIERALLIKAIREEMRRPRFEIVNRQDQEPMWRLRGRNRRILATSGEGFSSRSNVRRSIRALRRAIADAIIVEKGAD